MVGLPVCLLVEMNELIEMPIRKKTRVSPGNHVLDGGLVPPTGRGTFEGKSVP